ncbi:hypothetical protein cyc_03159 [Cyclospora cayetanensis]|uniref:Transmembrane protein n=1 Tax=Cyclospora cayetanensis TaxID=88456 RepID=A0A1D3DAJ0_9EIME|nr:hypothetical protein cyc_03159 [Cyclospora cayetanensis]
MSRSLNLPGTDSSEESVSHGGASGRGAETEGEGTRGMPFVEQERHGGDAATGLFIEDRMLHREQLRSCLLQPNMLEADRARLYYWNLFSIAATAVPIWYMMHVNYRFCEESVLLSESLGASRSGKTDLALYYPHKLQQH